MITAQSLKQHDSLLNFINATTDQGRNVNQQHLKNCYSLYRMNNQVAADADFSKPRVYSALEVVAMLGMLEHVKCLLEYPTHHGSISNGASALLLAAEAGHLNVVKALFDYDWIRHEIYTDLTKQLWIKAAKSGNLDLINYLFNCDSLQNVFIQNVNSILRDAVLEGHANIVERILQEPNLDDILLPTPLIQRAIHYHYEDIISKLLNVPHILSFALQHDLSEKYIYPEVQLRLITFKNEQIEINPTLCIDIIRYLIKKDKLADHPNIKFLLNIPAVKSVVLKDLVAERPNQLLLLAMEQNHAAEIYLLNEPSIRSHAERHDYYGVNAAKMRQYKRDNEDVIKTKAAFLCLLPLIDVTLPTATTHQMVINQRIGSAFLPSICLIVLSYLLPNPLKQPNVEDKFYLDMTTFFKKIKKTDSTDKLISQDQNTSNFTNT